MSHRQNRPRKLIEVQRKSIASVIPIRHPGSTVNPPDGPANIASPQVFETTDARCERRRPGSRYTSILPRVQRACEYALKRALYRLAERYQLEYPACRAMAREYLEREWRADLERGLVHAA